jgi:RimJ/RimL family protein N-acetyltransferase
MYVHLQTERLSLRPLNPEDSPFIFRLLNTEGWLTFIGDRNVTNTRDAKDYIQKILCQTKYFYTVVELKETGQAIGIVTFLERENQKYPDIGFALLPEFERKGYTFEACKRYLEEVKSINKYENILGITLSNNVKSINLLRKLGLKHELDFTEQEQAFSLYSIN